MQGDSGAAMVLVESGQLGAAPVKHQYVLVGLYIQHRTSNVIIIDIGFVLTNMYLYLA